MRVAEIRIFKLQGTVHIWALKKQQSFFLQQLYSSCVPLPVKVVAAVSLPFKVGKHRNTSKTGHRETRRGKTALVKTAVVGR